MNIFEYFNTAILSCIIIILISIDYMRKYSTDNFQRKLLLAVLVSVFVAALFDYLGLTLERSSSYLFSIRRMSENSAMETNTKLRIIWSVYLLARNCCFYYGAVFIEYFAHGNVAKSRVSFIVTTVFLTLFATSLIPNFTQGYYFSVTRDNIYVPGSLYMIQILISYLPIILILINVTIAPKQIKRTQIFLTIFFVIISAIGAAIDIVFRVTNILWPCITTALLYVYFFIIRTDAKIDSLTGIGNRNNFYEYINHLSKQSEKKEYKFIKIDLEYLEKINDSFGYMEGDNALRDTSTIIKSCIRHTDFAVRYGGDEFIIITTADNDSQRIMDRIMDYIDTQNKKQTRPYMLSINYSYDVFTTNSSYSIQDFLSHLDGKIQKNKAK
ncbi:MAG: GGDEF domain-containing protein [Treponema sp.]|nr:GGDEF domain-containing protein [Treponema sp.]MCL2236880.1 GGDEF domain-containing protein [Treponema sp.]